MLGTLIGALRWYKRRYQPHPELVRKLLHIGMGLTALTFPWLFTSPWPVLLLAAITVPGLLLFRRVKTLKRQLGGVIDGVERTESLGEIYFPLGVAALFLLSGGEPLRYSIPLLLLALGDAVAALVGVRYGLLHYTTLEGHKSAEGSLAFFIVAFFSAHIPLLLFSQTGRAETLLISLILGFLLMMVEAIAWHGLDNLLIPVVGFLLLNTFLEMNVTELVIRLCLTLALVIFVFLWRRQAYLNDSALFSAALIGYLSWTLADWRWFLSPFIVFIGHIFLASARQLVILGRWDGSVAQLKQIFQAPPSTLPRKNPAKLYNIYAVLSVGSGGLLWLLVFTLLHRQELRYPFTLAYAAQLALLVMITLRDQEQHISPLWLLGHAVFWGWLCLFVPYVLVEGFSSSVLSQVLVALFGVVLAALTFYYLQPVRDRYPTDHPRWVRQAVCGLFGSLVGLGPLYLI
jgi:phytol kinase